MKKTITRGVASLGAVSVMFLAGICLPANAAPIDDDVPASGASFQRSSVGSEKTSPDAETDKNAFSASVFVTDARGTQQIDITSSSTIEEVLKSRGITGDFHTVDDTPVELSQYVKNGDNLLLFGSEVSTTSDVVKLPRPERTQNSDELYVGETKVQNEGKDGEAIKTVVHTKDLAADGSLNSAKKGNRDDTTTEEKLTVLVQPEAKITLVGTKDRPQVRSSSSTSSNAGVSVDSLPKSVVDSNDALISLALKQVGKAYVWGAEGPDSFDCSGLIWYLYQNVYGRSIPRTADAQGRAATPIALKDIKPGDIIWSNSHIGLYIGDGKMLHASNPNRGVVIDNMQWAIDSGFQIGRL